ncbi:SPX domain-containing protein [Amylocystis lapponica]|nr:SPX domain-containing protein [Amylocystis lapponica]
MHFSKTYQQLLLALPPELRDNAIEYRKLKKLINQVVTELASLGFSPEVLHDVLQPADPTSSVPISPSEPQKHEQTSLGATSQSFRQVYYELNNVSDRIEPRLRLLLDSSDTDTGLEPSTGHGVASDSQTVARQTVARRSTVQRDVRELVIPLVSDTAFFELLVHALQCLTTRLAIVRSDFETKLHALARNISLSARPMSATASFSPSKHSSNPAAVNVHVPSTLFSAHKSDLYAWREIFQAYVEAEIFESHHERDRGERTVEDAEQRLDTFMQRMNDRGLVSGHALKLKESRQALQTFLQLNTFILDLRKFQTATTEATRKILKKHAKRTALPLAPALSSPFFVSSAVNTAAMILPVIPHIDDYACLICTSIAFKPIRLRCGHLFCVRCLVKMQKRGQGDCPMCRAPTVLSADRSNVDWALLNFMKDWFPVESRQKLQQNEREAAQEELEELGLDVRGCILM